MLLTAPDCFSSSLLPFASIKNSTAAVILKRFRLNSVSRTGTSRRLCRASLITSPDSFEVGRLIGSYGFMNITRLTYNNFPFFLFFFFFKLKEAKSFLFICLFVFYCVAIRGFVTLNIHPEIWGDWEFKMLERAV